MADIVERLRDCWLGEPVQSLMEEAAVEITRLRAGGCARDQGLTQYCAEAARLAEENADIRRLANKYLAEVASKDKQFEDYVRRMADDITSMSAEADDQIAALKAEVARLRAALEEIVKPGGADDFWQCVAIASAALTNNFNIKED